jgi:D-sedoheptulose 7-phosphate isomerase
LNEQTFIKNYLNSYRETLLDSDVSEQLINMKNMLLEVSNNGKKVIIVGNGGSAAIASHVAVDLTKQARIRTVNFNETDLITCFANDYGYENWVAKCLEFYGDEKDMVILISSSGKSQNIVNAAIQAKKMNMNIVSLTGFASENPLKQKGDLNFWVDSKAYNVIENVHQIWLLLVCDLIIGKAEYSA